MTHFNPPAQGAPATACDEEYSLPGAEAVLAGTLALMTGYAQAGCASHREALACKVVANLLLLGQSGTGTPHFRAMLWNLQARWAPLCDPGLAQPLAASPVPAAQRRALWMPAPQVVQ